MSLIEVRNVKKSYKGLTIFQDIDLTIEKGKIYGIVGPNGSGKSVLFKLICGFVRPDHGEIVIRGEYLHKDITFPKNFGVIIDRPGYLGNKTGFENLKSLAMIQNKIDDEQIIKTMELVGLQPTAEQKVRKYSLGMKQKLALAQAFMENQEVLILDEPFNALDFESVENLRSLLLNYKKEGKTIIMTSHNQEDIDLLCDEVYRINKFKLEKL
ncbi:MULTISPECIES: ATP-binding cassette domain-containing protein [Lysinibacillus]|uniref:Multidrug ABC transporter ATP-binding protein n=1 Tax=Lysinibacillus fusiformis TaxID=28031 RepID=A0A2I0UY92_9BACI|nr:MULTISPECIES: ATP-binding cassette domain-containing protein [Lysinibacillus]PKU50959.1 multidrug ABC transporter ATP-binding protein [Lysinibacillus fusiformis]WCH49470.1 ATP-binding cassette domain-containing protein [Lysinibacillus sp. OF-1]SCY16418.1 ABC-2 type transport system ATP-binding protein [Lysinibacillus sp. SG9]SDB11103.1 ABC-2 type transport system ATP-binding protein [Lysinibacillus sp. TC-37]SFS48202.1 ABC-2 type transport system ATP-binding protein [Lysinibacillus sp. SG55